MNHLKRVWKRIPDKPRRILTFVVGMLIIALAGIVGPFPGPGGIVVFLLGIAVLATEFSWAERLQHKMLDWLKVLGAAIRKYPYRSAGLISIGAAILVIAFYFIYTKVL